MKTMELNKMGLAPIDCFEMSNTNGGAGAWKKFLKRVTLFGILNEVIDHWDEIKHGLGEGWNFDKHAK